MARAAVRVGIGLLLLTSWLFGAEIPLVAPEDVGLSAECLASITTVLEDHVAADRIAGGVALIAWRGAIGYLEPFGMEDREAGVPMRRDAIFRIYSMTKPVTSVGVMMLFEEGRFALRDPVSRFLPELGNLKVAVKETNPETGEAVVRYVPADREITIRDLVCHTSGLTYEFMGESAVHRMYTQAFARVGEMDLGVIPELALDCGPDPT